MLPMTCVGRVAQESHARASRHGPMRPARLQACVMSARVSAVSRCGSVLNVTR